MPPQEARAAAAEMRMRSIFEVRGHKELEARVTDAYERFVAGGGYEFRRRDDVERLRDVVKFRWEMVSTEDGSIAGVGLEFLVFDDEGRIRSDYQFMEELNRSSTCQKQPKGAGVARVPLCAEGVA